MKKTTLVRGGVFLEVKKNLKLNLFLQRRPNKSGKVFKSLWGNQLNVDNWNSLSPVTSEVINEEFNSIDVLKTKNPEARTVAYYINLLPKKTETIDSLKRLENRLTWMRVYYTKRNF